MHRAGTDYGPFDDEYLSKKELVTRICNFCNRALYAFVYLLKDMETNRVLNSTSCVVHTKSDSEMFDK